MITIDYQHGQFFRVYQPLEQIISVTVTEEEARADVRAGAYATFAAKTEIKRRDWL